MTHVFHAGHVCGAGDDEGAALLELDAGAHSCCDAAAHVTAGTRDSTVSTVSQLRQLYDTSLHTEGESGRERGVGKKRRGHKHVVEGRERGRGDGRDALQAVVREDQRLQVCPVREGRGELGERVAAEHAVCGAHT